MDRSACLRARISAYAYVRVRARMHADLQQCLHFYVRNSSPSAANLLGAFVIVDGDALLLLLSASIRANTLTSKPNTLKDRPNKLKANAE